MLLDNDSREFELLVYEVRLLKEVLLQKENKLKESCQHMKIKRGLDSGDCSDLEIIHQYTYKCLICGQRWSFYKPYEKFEIIADETETINRNNQKIKSTVEAI